MTRLVARERLGGGSGGGQGDSQRPYPWINYAGCWGKDSLARSEVGPPVPSRAGDVRATVDTRQRTSSTTSWRSRAVRDFGAPGGISRDHRATGRKGSVLWRDKLEPSLQRRPVE
jgi:hypothetical protein